MVTPSDGIPLRPAESRAAEIYVLVVLAVFGTAACFLLPVSAGYDEEDHVMRVWEMSASTFLPNQRLGADIPFPAVVRAMSYRDPSLVRAVAPEFWEAYGGLSLDSRGYIPWVKTRSVYSPPLLLPQALAMRLFGRELGLSALATYYASRLAGLWAYLLLAWLAVRSIPYGKWLLAIAATVPVAILQSATITPDTISNGVALLFVGGVLALAAKKELSWREVGLLILLGSVLFWGKVNIIPLALLPFLAIRPSQYKHWAAPLIVLGAFVILFVLEVVAWNLMAYARYEDALTGADPVAQLTFIRGDPGSFLSMLVGTASSEFAGHLTDSIAIYGYDYWPVPALTYVFFYAAVAAAWLTGRGAARPDAMTRLALLTVFLASYLWTIVALYLSYTPAGSPVVAGLQGRYITGLLPLLLIAAAAPSLPWKLHLPAAVPIALGLACVLTYVSGMYLSYHVPCGSHYYVRGLCYQPKYKNWSPNQVYSQPVGHGMELRQTILAECAGMTELRVWTDGSSADPSGTTLFTFQSIEGDRELVNAEVPNPHLPTRDWYTLEFDPDWQSEQGAFMLVIRGGEGQAGPRFATSSRQEYRRGKLFENGTAVDGDLLFQMGCVAGWDR